MPKKSEHVSAVEAARLTGLSEKTIRRKIESGELKAEKRGVSYAIRVKDLDKLTGQRPPSSDVLLQKIQELEEIQTSQAAQINAQAEQIAMLEHRIEELERRPAPTATRPLLPTISQIELDEDRTPTAPLGAPSLPPGSMLLVRFAEQYGLAARTLTDHARRGQINVTVIDKGGRPQYWLTPEQQDELRRQRGL
jgi:excisionase family DNA binding protein